MRVVRRSRGGRRKERTKMNWNRQNLCLAYDSKLQKSAQKEIKAKS